jgi:hypothetical protein
MRNRPALSLAIGSLLALTAAGAVADDVNPSAPQLETSVSARETFITLAGVQAVAMTGDEMAKVEGKAHDTFPLGALLLENTGGRIADTPAWTADHGLHPARALSKAQVPDHH